MSFSSLQIRVAGSGSQRTGRNNAYETFLKANKLRSNAVYPIALDPTPAAASTSAGAKNTPRQTGGVSPGATDTPLSTSGVSPTTPTPAASSSCLVSADPPLSISGGPIADERSTGPPPQISRVSTPDHTIPQTDEDHARDAIISINMFNIQDPPLTLRFGKFNPRQLSRSGIKTLATEFLYGTFTPFKMECMIPLLLHRGDIDDSCINLDPTLGPHTPELLLTEVGKALGDVIACGGNHRVAAVKEVDSNLEKQWISLNDRLTDMKGKSTGKGVKVKGSKKKVAALKKKGKSAKGKGKSAAVVDTADEGNDRDDSSNADDGRNMAECTAESLKSQMADLRAHQKRFSTWGVIVYDIGKPIIHPHPHYIY